MFRNLIFVAVVLLVASCGADSPTMPKLNVLFVTFDTTRADHIGAYGNAAAQTDHIDSLAQEGVLFEWAYSSAPITAPSHTTMLTGLNPTAHGVRDNGLFVLDSSAVTLPEVLKGSGYATAASIASFPLSGRFGLNQGFDLYDDNFTAPYEDFRGSRVVQKTRMFFDERPAELVNEPLMAWLTENHDRPFFAWAHYFDPHLPLEPPPPYDQLFLSNPYLGEIAYADEMLGQLLDHLEKLGVADRTIVVVTADHGEGLGQHNETTHSTLLYDTTLHVPLVIKIPGKQLGLRVSERVGLVDLMPTLLELLDIDAAPPMHGASLVPLIEDDGRFHDFPRPQYAETLSPRVSHGLGELRALFDDDYKYIFGPRPELYTPKSDPGELKNLIDEQPEVARRMRNTLEAVVGDQAVRGASQQVAMDDETRRRLASLGYISMPGDAASGDTAERLDGSGVPPQDRVADVNEVSLAKNELLNNRPEGALALANALLRRAPDHVYYLQIRASAELMLGQTEASIETLERIVDLDPRGLPSQDVVLQLVEALYHDGQQSRALRVLNEQQKSTPTPLGQWYVASLSEALEDAEGQARALDFALELDPSFAPARVDRAIRLVANQRDYDSAMAELTRALADWPYYAKAHYNTAVTLIQLNDYEKALIHLRRAVELRPAYPRALHALVVVSARAGDTAVATQALLSLQRFAPESALAQDAALVLLQE